jgi:hypothetical protein
VRSAVECDFEDVKALRGIVAAASIVAILALGAVVAFAAPASVTKPASASASAARAVYCPPEERDRRKQERDGYKQGMAKAKAAYFKKHKKAKDRKAFTKAQQVRLAKLNRTLNSCE